MDTASEPHRIYLFICRRYRGQLAAVAQRQSNNSDPEFTDEEVLKTATASYVFGLIKKRTTISEIHLCVEDHFSDWFPDLPSYQSYNRRLNRLSAVFAPLVQKALSEVSCQKTRKQVVRIADSMPIMLAKGQRASQATVASDRLASDRLASVGYCSHGVKLHVVAQQRDGTLPLLQQAGLTPGSENDLHALRRVLPNIEGGVLCGDWACCDGPLKEQLAEDQDLDLLTPAREKQRAKDALCGRYPLFRGRKPDASTNRVPIQLDQRENRNSTGLEGALVQGTPRSCLRSARRCDASSRSQPLIRIKYRDRNVVEQCVSRLRERRRIAARHEKKAGHNEATAWRQC